MQHRKVLPLTTIIMALLVIVASVPGAAGELRGRVVSKADAGPAVVWIEGLEGGTAPHVDTVLTHVKGGAFEPQVSIGFVGNDFVLRNEDDTMHNSHLHMLLGYQRAVSDRPLELGATLYNIALPKGAGEVRRPIKPYHRYRDDTGFIEVFCDRHPAEKAYVLVFDHPYAALTAADGTFAIPDVPPGSHRVRVWQGGVVKDWKQIDVKADGVTEATIELGS
jgi:hypothetical protein